MAFIRYDIPFTFNDNDFLDNGSVSPGSVSKAFQSTADAYSYANGIGLKDLLKKGLMWVIVKLRFEILGNVKPDTEYTAATVPHRRKGVIYVRDFYISDADGNVLIKGSSQWCILNYNTRMISREKCDIPGEYIEEPVFTDGFPVLSSVASGVPVYKHTVAPEDIDENGHTNNCRYTAMIAKVPGISPIRSLYIHFDHESFLGEEITVLQNEVSDEKLLYGVLPDGKVIFSAKVS